MRNIESVTKPETLDRGFLFGEVQNSFPYEDWKPASYAVMDAFETTFKASSAPTAAVMQNREVFVESIRTSLKTLFGEKANGARCIGFVEQTRQFLTPVAEPALVP